MQSPEQVWIRLRGTLWFVPSLLVLGAILMAFGLIQLDEALGEHWAARWPRLYGAGAEGSRGMLSAIATSMVTVAGVTFSITVVALAQASSQYSPLVLRNFMRDRANQIVLGVFGGIFVYCLIVLRSIRGGDDEFVPSVAVVAALIQALAGIGILLFFIHHIATVLQASTILATIADGALKAVDSLFPEELGDAPDEQSAAPSSASGDHWHPVCASRIGYVQAVRSQAMLDFACSHDIVLRMECGIGDFVAAETPVASIGLGRAPDEPMRSAVADLFVIGEYRTIEQDAAFGLRQIVDIALRALSPGINDPTTACSCLDYIGAVLLRLARRRLTTAERHVDGTLRVIAIGPTFESLTALAFEQIGQHAAVNPQVLAHMIEIIRHVGLQAHDAARKGVLLHHLARIGERAQRGLELDSDRERFDRVLADAADAINRGG